MPKDDSFTISGEVIEALPNAQFRIKIENGNMVLAHLAGKLRMHRITIIPGDRVDLEMSTYDLTKGRITYRHKN